MQSGLVSSDDARVVLICAQTFSLHALGLEDLACVLLRVLARAWVYQAVNDPTPVDDGERYALFKVALYPPRTWFLCC